MCRFALIFFGFAALNASEPGAMNHARLKTWMRDAGLSAWSAGCGVLERRERAFFDGPAGAAETGPFASSLRVALVKQTTYSDLYGDPAARSPRELLESSWHRTGPIGLFTQFDSRFFIVRPEIDPECRVFEEKLAYAHADPLRAADDAKRREMQEIVAVSSQDVNWSDFDVVIAIENAVPARVTRKHPGVLWATLLEHHRMAPFREYLRHPPAGYDAFLNLRFGPNPQSLLRRAHVIDWPYNLNTARGLTGLYPTLPKENLILLEDHQSAEMKQALTSRNSKWVGGEVTAQTLGAFMERLVRSKVFCAAQPTRPLGGLALIDAVAAGCVVIADRTTLWNPFLVPSQTNVRNSRAAAELTKELMADDVFFRQIQSEQSRRLTWFCFTRPLRQIADLVQTAPRRLSAREHLIRAGS